MIKPYRSVAECLAVIGWNNSVFANRLGISPRWAVRLKNDPVGTPAPMVIVIWLNRLADFHDEYALPETWETRRGCD